MHRGIAAYIVIFIILVILAWVFLLNHPSPKAITITVTTTISNRTSATTTTIPYVNTTSISTTTTIRYVGTCISNSTIVPIYNGNFSTGTYAGWNVSGVGFGTAPLNITYANENNGYYGHPWVGYNGLFFATTYHGGIGLQPGNLTSNAFKVVEPYLNFRIISPQNKLIYVEILKGNVPEIIYYYNTYNVQNNTYPSSEFVNVSIPLVTLLCQNVSIRVVSGVVGGVVTRNQYVAVGDFYLSKNAINTPGAIVSEYINQSV